MTNRQFLEANYITVKLSIGVWMNTNERVLKHYEFVTSAVDACGARYGLHLK